MTTTATHSQQEKMGEIFSFPRKVHSIKKLSRLPVELTGNCGFFPLLLNTDGAIWRCQPQNGASCRCVSVWFWAPGFCGVCAHAHKCLISTPDSCSMLVGGTGWEIDCYLLLLLSSTHQSKTILFCILGSWKNWQVNQKILQMNKIREFMKTDNDLIENI